MRLAASIVLLIILAPLSIFAAAPPPQDSAADSVLKDLALEAFKKSMGPGGELISNVNSFAIDPLVTASTTHGTTKDKLQAWLNAMARAGLDVAWPAYGLAIKGGEIVVGGTRGGVEALLESLQDDQNRAILFGKAEDNFLDRFNNIMADTPFIDHAGVRGLTADNLGSLITSETMLRKQWDFYIRELKDLYGAENAETAKKNWPRLLKIWQLQRAAVVLTQMTERLSREMARAISEAKEKSAAGTSEVKTNAPVAQSIPGTFGPPKKKLGHPAPPFEANDRKIAGTMSERSYTFYMETKEPKAISTVTMKWTGELPEILKPGDVITLKTYVEAVRSSPDAPNAWANCNWYAVGSVKILNEKKTFAGMASSGAFVPSDAGELKFEVLTGGTITIGTGVAGQFWGSSDNWTPAEYVYTYTPKR
jgi:hypothetical protein